MTMIDYAYSLFSDVKNKKYSFAYALNKKMNEMSLSSSEMTIIKDALKGTLNRYYFLRHEIRQNLPVSDEKDLDVLILTLSFARYARNFTVDDAIADLEESGKENSYSFDMERAAQLLRAIGSTPTPIVEHYENNFVKKVSLTYSYPEWLIGMMKKHFGTKNTFKSVASSRRSAPIAVSVNPFLMQEPLDENLFRKTPVATTSYEYIGKEPLISNELFVQKKIFVMEQTEQLLADVIVPREGDEILVAGENKVALANSIAMRLDDFGKVYLACNGPEAYYSAKKANEKFGMKSTMVIDSDITLLCTHIDNKQCDKVVLLPPNSEFGLVRRKPEILISFRQEELDQIIETERIWLETTSQFVKEEGTLLYAVPTMNNKESYRLIRDFLASHPDFELSDEQMIFPYMYQTCAMYYAKLFRKGTKEAEND